MSLRYKLSKERFKGKKLPPKIVSNEDLISPDQRGDQSSTDKKSPLSLDKITSTITKPLEDNDVSRRGLLGSLNIPQPARNTAATRVSEPPGERETTINVVCLSSIQSSSGLEPTNRSGLPHGIVCPCHGRVMATRIR